MHEMAFLEETSKTYRDSLQSDTIRRLAIQTFLPYLNGGVALELGCSDGLATNMIASKVDQLDVIDGSKYFIEKAKNNLEQDNVYFYYSLFEEFQQKNKQKYDYIFASYVLEHVMNVEEIFHMMRSNLKDDGLLFITVPNSRALSRQLALHMGLLDDLKILTANDTLHGHRRVYDRVTLNKEIEKFGFISISQGGIMLKILADFQMDELMGKGILLEEHIQGLYKLGLEYPDLCGSLFSVCKKARDCNHSSI
ncbi:hypothetical protein BHU72_00245 [Desulfuribacillus stibiiarsenatis]|uniref:Methyltransferase domain-containing protein n=1 Tax=Desulfuribacillus stibiiarsenatis TaxID=1390249 RepID=A0A1E5LA70_9FIRM|nr:hypothetical protein BHU72_00245 [Desulfuribacillus stibiiarsenatis]